MKIKDLKCMVMSDLRALLVRVDTDEGISGLAQMWMFQTDLAWESNSTRRHERSPQGRRSILRVDTAKTELERISHPEVFTFGIGLG